MKLFDFSKRFSRVAAAWMEKNSGKMKPEEMEEKLPDIYLRWLDTPTAWLDGESPNSYFGRITDAKQLVLMLLEYFRADIPVPEPLEDRLVECGSETQLPLARLYLNDAAPAHARSKAGELLVQIGGRMPVKGSIELIRNENTPESVLETAISILRAAGKDAEPALLEIMDAADSRSRRVLLDILADLGDDPRILDWTLYELNNHPDDRTVYISYLLRLGDERALLPLRSMLTLSDLRYVDYLEISNAIESLGGEADVVREFAGDEDYEGMIAAGTEPEQEPDFGIDLEPKTENTEQNEDEFV